MKTLTEFCIEVDQAADMPTITALQDELLANRKKYSLIDLQFANEYLVEKAKAIVLRELNEIQAFFKTQ